MTKSEAENKLRQKTRRGYYILASRDGETWKCFANASFDKLSYGQRERFVIVETYLVDGKGHLIRI